jgi:hypothetical protein
MWKKENVITALAAQNHLGSMNAKRKWQQQEGEDIDTDISYFLLLFSMILYFL